MRRFFLLLAGCFILTSVSAQTDKVTVRGVVIDSQGEALIGVSVIEKGTTNGTQTDLDGAYEIAVPANAVLEFSFVGFTKQEIAVNGRTQISLTMKENAEMLDEVVVIGYGAVKKGDLTGSITAIGEKDFQKGVMTSPTELITGKVAGVQITSNGGRAGSGSRIRIRGGASLNASNDPLIVVDGVPLDVSGISGSSDALSTINPNDIESMNVLKDASATAIYGSRASNGVVLITTKKGKAGQKLNINLSTQNSLSYNSKKVDVMSANQFREAVGWAIDNYPINPKPTRFNNLLGTANTDWQDEIYRVAFTTDNNLSLSGSYKNMPYRVSVSYLDQDGILDTDNMKRTTGAISLSPTFLQDHLSVNINLKGTYTNQRFGNGDAIGAALRMDPTQPVKASGFDEFNGYWAWLEGGKLNNNATKNPVALLKSKNDKSDVYRSIGNAQFDYKMHFLPELRANLNLGYDISQGKGNVVVQKWGPQAYYNEGIPGSGGSIGGERSKYKQNKRNLLMEFYLNYAKDLKEIDSRFDVMGGYTYQDWKTKDYNYTATTYDGDPLAEAPAFPSVTYQNTLISYFGRLNYTFKERYLLTATLRRDGSSRFSKDNRWGTFPSVALAWRLSEEDFMSGFDKLSNLKLRLGYGVTGQQEVGNYEYIPTYSYSESSASVQLGNQFYQMWRPNGYDKDRKWEQTQTYNVGLDYGFFDGRVNGAVDYYYKKTKDLLALVYLPLGSNYTNMIVKNIGKLNNQGVEFNVNVVAIQSNDIQWDLGFNATYNKSEITQLSKNDKNNAGITTGGISGGTGSTVQIHSVGYAPNAFYVYKQLYDTNGKPIEGAYADLNGDGVVNENDRYRYKKPEADWFFGFNTNFTYQQWSVGTALRASLGNYMYNNIYSDAGNFNQVLNPNEFLMNAPKNILKTEFYNRNLFSDYYVRNASFLKMDYINVGYDFGKISKKYNVNLKANFTVQNVFTLTKYDGVDPEIAGGIDNNFYPNPRTFVLGLNLNF
ncbi:TonB-dependent receptor [Dysgonomonas sp. 25]|nr:TonB-dependent receptor [Dysgonomonas sp. 25]